MFPKHKSHNDSNLDMPKKPLSLLFLGGWEVVFLFLFFFLLSSKEMKKKKQTLP